MYHILVFMKVHRLLPSLENGVTPIEMINMFPSGPLKNAMPPGGRLGWQAAHFRFPVVYTYIPPPWVGQEVEHCLCIV